MTIRPAKSPNPWMIATISTLTTCSLAAGYFLYGKPRNEAADLGANQEVCFDWGNLCFKDMTDAIKLPNNQGDPTDYRGQTWGVAWGRANNNEWPDLYLNHHRELNTSGRFPTSHLILDIGKNQNSKDFRILGRGDQHSAIFIDLNSDGIDEILETIGGRQGNAEQTNTGTHNQLHLINKTEISPQQENKSAISWATALGIEQAGARGRQVVPFVLDNNLFLAFLNQGRKDGRHAPNFMKRNNFGTFEDEKILGRQCTTEACATQPFEIERFKSLSYGLLSDDNLPDLLLCQYNRDSTIKAFIRKSSKSAPLISRSVQNQASRFCLLSFFPSIRKNLVITEAKDHIELLTYSSTNNRLTTYADLPLINNSRSRDLAVADINNDGIPDMISLQKLTASKGGGTSLAILLSNKNACKSITRSCYREKIIKMSDAPAPRNLSLADFNNDGSVDILIGAGKTKPGPQKGGKYILLAGKSKGNWISIDLKCQSDTNAIGSLVSIDAGPAGVRTYLKTGGTRHETQDHSRIHIGLGESTFDRLKANVAWPNGKSSRNYKLPLNSISTIKGGKLCNP